MNRKLKIVLIFFAVLVAAIGALVVAVGYQPYKQAQARAQISDLLAQLTELRLNFSMHVITERESPPAELVEKWIDETTDITGISYLQNGVINIDLPQATDGRLKRGSLLLVPQLVDNYDVQFACVGRNIDPVLLPSSCR